MRASRAFSLTEVLVAIAILSGLAGVVFPVLAGVRSASRKQTCTGNLRQLGAALVLYSADNDGLIPPYLTWVDWHIRGRLMRSEPEKLVNVVQPYLKSRAVWFCPVDPYAGKSTPRFTRLTGMVDHQYSSYFSAWRWMIWVASSRGYLDRHIAPTRLEARTRLLTDYAWLNDSSESYGHEGRVRWLWGDGSVRTVTDDDIRHSRDPRSWE